MSELTPRELEILKMLANGRPIKEIARALNLSAKTIEVHKHNMMHKLGLHKTALLVHYAIAQGIIPLLGNVFPK